MAKAAADDGHHLFAPTHYIYDETASEIVGATNTGPYVDWWVRTGKGARASLMVLSALDAVQAAAGYNDYRILCSKDSPYYPVIERHGFFRAGEMTLFQRTIPRYDHVRTESTETDEPGNHDRA